VKEIMPRHRKPALVAMKRGFVKAMTRHTALFYQRSNRTLVVTFDNMKSRETPSPAYPWGYDFLAKQDYSHLGIVMRRRNDWFRHKDLANFFDTLRDDGFFNAFKHVVFYGSSMGGYGALAYASASPGARVVAFSPQTSLDPAHARFETRYRNGFARGDWSGPYLDGAYEARTANSVTVFYDPYERIDCSHVSRLEVNTQLNRMKMPFAGHDTMRRLAMQEILPEICLLALEGKLTAKDFNIMLRAHRGVQAVARKSLNLAIDKGHPKLVMATLSQLEKTKPEWNFPKIKRAAQEAIDRSVPHS
jgi:pimeloyl-ACP methyl ester carboxylesterase